MNKKHHFTLIKKIQHLQQDKAVKEESKEPDYEDDKNKLEEEQEQETKTVNQVF